MKPLLVLSVALVIAVAGCTGKSPPVLNDPDALDPAPDPTKMRTLIHALDATGAATTLLTEADFPEEIPILGEQYVATRSSGEPTIAVTKKSAFYPSIAFDGTGGMLARTEIYRSQDNGASWTEVTPNVGGQDLPPQSLDPYVYADPATGRVFSIDLYVGCSWLSFTDDEGATWTTNPIACGIPVNDHQTLFAGKPTVLPASPLYPNILYYCVNQIADAICTHSLDGGLTWTPGTPAYLGADPSGGFCGGLHGHGHASMVDGYVYLPKGHCGVPMVSVSADNGLTWTSVAVANRDVGISGHEANVHTDSKGNVYYFWLDKKQMPRLAVSKDHGRTWSKPMAVAVPELTAAKFPSIVAGDEGRIAFLYIGTTGQGGLTTDEGTWNAYVGISLNALDAAPIVATTTANPLEDPLKRGPCEGRCQGMYDFMDIDINPETGQVWVALVDLCNDECAKPEGSPSDPITSRGAVGVQTGGAKLKGSSPKVA